MSSRNLHIATQTLGLLPSEQIDAIELACLDCKYELNETLPNKAIEDIQRNKEALLLTDLESLLSLAKTHTSLPLDRIIVSSQSTNALSNPKIQSQFNAIGDIPFLLGTAFPNLTRTVLASILEYQLTRQSGFRGLCSRLFKVEALKHFKHRLQNSGEREELQNQVSEFFTAELSLYKNDLASGIASYPKNIADVLDEFLMNAIWDANPIRENAERTVQAELGHDELVEVTYGFDGTNMVLSVEDHHGTFPIKAMRGPIRYALGLKDETRINEGPGGAGLGLFMVLQKVALLAIEVQEGKRTRAIAVLRADVSMREMQKRPRTVLFFKS